MGFSMTKRGRKPALCAIVAAVLAACTYNGADIGNPLERKTSWFSYVGGDDIRATCDAGTPDRFRVVYNGIWGQQLRMYEVDGLRRVLNVHVTRSGNLMHFTANDLTAPWKAAEARVPLDAVAYDQLIAAYTADGMFAPPPVGLDLPARSYFWTAAWCKDGRFGVTAWKYPSAAFSALTFDRLLFAQDTTGIAVVRAAPVPLDPLWESEARQGKVTDFQLTVGKSGLVR
jgi:hypothetical protein